MFGSIYKFDGQVSVFNHEGGPTYRCLYPEPSELEACGEVGVLGVLPGLTGCLMANEVIKLITGIGELLSGTLLVFNALTMSFNTFSFTANPVNKAITALPKAMAVCTDAVPEITPSALRTWLAQDNKPFLLDVRQPNEYQQDNLNGLLLPLADLSQQQHLIPMDRPVVVHCQSGGRSQQAVAYLIAQGYSQVFNLRGGLTAFRSLPEPALS